MHYERLPIHAYQERAIFAKRDYLLDHRLSILKDGPFQTELEQVFHLWATARRSFVVAVGEWRFEQILDSLVHRLVSDGKDRPQNDQQRVIVHFP